MRAWKGAGELRERKTVLPTSTGFRGISYLTSRSRCDQSDYRYAVIAHYGTFGIQIEGSNDAVAEYTVKMET